MEESDRHIPNNDQTTERIIRVVIIDDHEVVRQGLLAMLRKDDRIEFVGEASNSTNGLAIVKDTNPDLVLIDVQLGGSDISGFELARRIKSEFSNVRILMLTGYDSELYLTEALRVKVDGFILKEHPRTILSCAIKMAYSGISVWDTDIFYRAIGNISEKQQEEVKSGNPLNRRFGTGLNEKERQIFLLLAKGYSNKDIANQLKYSPATIKKYVHTCLIKLGATNRTQLAVLAKKDGL